MFIRASRHDFQVTAADDMASWLRASNTPSLDEIASKLAQLRDRIPPPPPPVAPTVELGPDYAHATIAPVRRVERAARVECRVACTQTVHAVRQLSPHQRQRRNTGGLLAPGMTLAPRRVCRHLSWSSTGRLRRRCGWSRARSHRGTVRLSVAEAPFASPSQRRTRPLPS